MDTCACGCGQPTTVYKGKARRFVYGHQRRRLPVERQADLARHQSHWTACDVPYGLCLCGCGERTKISPETDRSHGWLAGEPRCYLVGHDKRLASREYIEDPQTECWMWQLSVLPSGYGQLRTGPAHRAYYERLVGPIPERHHLHHLCGRRLCVNPAHLQPMTQREHNRIAPHVKLTPEVVERLCEEFAAWTGSKRAFATRAGARLSVHPVTVEYALDGRTWR